MTAEEQNLDAELEQRLVGWAQWFLKGCGYKVGYPRISSTFWACYRIVKHKQRNQQEAMPSYPPAEEVDDWVRELSKWRPRLAQVLRCHYFTLGQVTEKARQLGLGRTQYSADLELGKAWLAARLLVGKKRR